MIARSTPTAARGLAWLTVDWLSLIVALALVALVKSGAVAGVPW
jgi:hypothetical protein